MGFKTDAVATVWKVKEHENDQKFRDVQISTSRKKKDSDQYETDFSGYVRFVGKAIEGVDEFNEKDRIRLKSVDVTRRYDKEQSKEYFNCIVFDWEKYEKDSSVNTDQAIASSDTFRGGSANQSIDEGLMALSGDDDEPPFV